MGFEPKEMHWWYKRLAQFMVENPQMNKKEIAKEFDRDPQTIYIVTNSDTFKAYYAQLMEAQEGALTGIAEKNAAVTEMALDHLLDALGAPGAGQILPPMDLKDIAHEGMQKMGYGAPKGPAVQINNNIIQAHPGELAAARDKYQKMFGDSSSALALPAPSPDGVEAKGG